MSLCALAAIGALTAAAIAATASILFRMMNSFTVILHGDVREASFVTRAIPPNSSRAASFPKTCDSLRRYFRHFPSSGWNPLKP
jgi:hypothetical protein